MKIIKIKDEAKLKTSELLDLCRKEFKVYSYYSDEELDKNFPIPKNPTERYFLDTIEADPENKNKSANDLKQEDQITLRERIIMELEYFKRTGNHLDIDNWTLCAGSRFSGGGVPRAGWGSGGLEFCVDWYDARHSYDFVRSRSVVSLETSTFNPLPIPNLKSFQTLVLKELLAKIQLHKAKQEFGNDYVFGYDDCLRIILEEINK